MSTQPLPESLTQVAFVVDNVANYQQPVDAFAAGIEVHVLDASQDGLAQIAATLEGRSGVGQVALEYPQGVVTADGAFDAVAVHSLDTPLNLPTGWQDVTPAMDVGHFVPGFNLSATDTFDHDDPLGLYFDSGTTQATEVMDATLTVTADTTTVSSFDLTGMTWAKFSPEGGFTFTVTGYKLGGGTVVTTFTSADGTLTYTSGNFSSFTGITRFDVNEHGTSDPFKYFAVSQNTFDGFTIANTVAANTAPAFVGAAATVSATENVLVDVSAVLHASDPDAGQTLTWSQQGAPSHGTLSFSGATAGSGGTNIAPGGAISYMPAAGYAGTDSFTVTLSDGQASVTRTITVNVNPATPGTPDLAPASDTGSGSGDNLTGAASLAFSGSGAAGDSSSTVHVFIDKNGNGVFDAGTDVSGSATMSAGAWTVSGLSTATLADGAYNVYAQATSATGGLASGISAPLSITLDTAAPTLAISSSASTLSAGQSATVTFTFSEDPGASFGLGDIAVSGGTLGALSGSGTVRTAVFTPAADTNGGVGSISVGAGLYADAAGNAGAAASAPSLSFDTLAPAAPSAPALAAGSDSGVSDSDALTSDATPTFSGTAEAGATVALYDGATLVGTAVATGGAWSITTTALGEGTHAITAIATDAGGNASAASAAQSVTIDTTGPALAISSDHATLKAGETATITFTFSEDPGATFSMGDIAVSGGTLGALSGSGATRSAVFTPDAGAEGATAAITVAAGSYTDNAGNAGAAAALNGLGFDTQAPAAPSAPALAAASDSGASSSDGVTNAQSLTFGGSAEDGATVTLVDAATSAVLGTAVAAGGAWSITLDGLGEGVAVVGAIATDSAGNASAMSATTTVTVDRSAPAAPALSLALDSGAAGDGLTNDGRVDVQGLADGASWEYSLDGGAHWIAGSGSQFAPGGDGTYAAIARQVDLAGNAGAASAAREFTVDTIGPTASVAISDTALASGETATVTIAFSEAVTGFDASDITVANGTLSGLASADGGRTWTAVLTPRTGVSDSTNTIGVNNAGVTDLAGNAGSGSSDSPNYTVSTASVDASIALSDTVLNAGETAVVTIRFSERVNGFTLADVHAENGALSQLASGDGGLTWTALLTPAAGINDTTNAVTLDNGGVTGIDGAPGDGTSTSANYAVATVRPTATMALGQQLLTPGSETTVTIKFSEAVSGFDIADLTASHGTLSALASGDGGRTWTAVLTAGAAGPASDPGYVTLDAGGVSNAEGNSGAGTVAAQFAVAPPPSPTGTGSLVSLLTSGVVDAGARGALMVHVWDLLAGLAGDAQAVPHGTLDLGFMLAAPDATAVGGGQSWEGNPDQHVRAELVGVHAQPGTNGLWLM